MRKPLKMPQSQNTKLSPDCWEIVLAVANEKGLTARAVIEGVIRTQTDQWIRGSAPCASPPVSTVDCEVVATVVEPAIAPETEFETLIQSL